MTVLTAVARPVIGFVLDLGPHIKVNPDLIGGKKNLISVFTLL